MTESDSNSAAGLERGLARALGNAGIGVIYQDRSLAVRWVHNLPAGWLVPGILGASDEKFLPAADLARILPLKQRLLASGEPARVEFRQGNRDGSRWYDMWLDADRDDRGVVVGIVTTLVDVTEHKHREQTLRTLLREVSHRSKNLLAIIQSIATQTGRHAQSLDIFLNRFRGRLQSLASSQDLVTSSNWRGATLSDLVAGQTSRYCDHPQRAIRLEGIDPYLTPNAALHIGLAIHELVVNSVSYGALSKPKGAVDLKAALAGSRNGFELVWSEETGQPVPRERPVRFGSIALERVVPASLEGEARLDIGDGRLEYRLLVPPSNFELA